MFRKGHSMVVELVSRPREDEGEYDNVVQYSIRII